MSTPTIPGVNQTTARDMLAALRRHYIRDEAVPAGIFAAEIDAPGGGRRADLIWHAEADRRQTWWESVQGGSEHTPARCRAFRAANGQGSR